MKAKYIIRFDDICPTMNWRVWDQIEEMLLELNISPILAVVPDNQDKNLQVAQPNSDFWEKVRTWQDIGWTIALHGYQHVYVTADAGIIGVNRRSEFAGLPLPEQEAKLYKAVEIFRGQGVRPELWIAPAHSFDKNTLLALKKIGINVVSDGYYVFPHIDLEGIMWIPQQLWRLRSMPLGVWTVCYHHNSFTQDDIFKLRKDLLRYIDSITCFKEVKDIYKYRRSSSFDPLVARFYLTLIRLKRRFRGFFGGINK